MSSCSDYPTADTAKTLKLDADTLNEVVTSTDELTPPASDGLQKLTLRGMQSLFAMTQINLPGGQWAAGVEFTAVNQYMAFNNVGYKVKNGVPLPYTTLGSDPTSGPDVGNVEPFEGVTSQDVTNRIGILSDYVFETVDDMQNGKPPSGVNGDVTLVEGNTVTIEERNNATFRITTDTANGANLIDTTTGLTASLIITENRFDAKAYGCDGSISTDDSWIVEIIKDHLIALTSTEGALVDFNVPLLRFDNPVDWSQTGGLRYQMRFGDQFETCEVYANYNGYGVGAISGAVFQFGDESAPAYQTSLQWGGVTFRKGPLCDRAPIAITGILAQSRIDNITFGSWNNTGIRLINPQNFRSNRVTTFSCGNSWLYKDASSVTVQQSGTTLTASGAIFAAGDVGKTISIWGIAPSLTRRKDKIVSYTSATEVELENSATDTIDKELYFAGAECGITAGTTTLFADAATFTANDVGLRVWIKGAGINDGLHYADIVSFTNSTTVEIDRAPVTTVTKAEFATAAIEIYSDPNFGNGGSDSRIKELQIENHKGVGLVVANQDVFHVEGKIHSEQSASGTNFSIAAVWGDQWSGSFTGNTQAQYLGESRFFVGNQTSILHIPVLTTRTATNEIVFEFGLRNPDNQFRGAGVKLGDIAVVGANALAAPRDLILDAEQNLGNRPLHRLGGEFNIVGNEDRPQQLGNNFWSKSNNTVVHRGANRTFVFNPAGGAGFNRYTWRDETAALDRWYLYSSGVFGPAGDGLYDLATPSGRIDNGYFVNTPTGTSDKTQKTDYTKVPVEWVTPLLSIVDNVELWRWIQAKAEKEAKGEVARMHSGPYAQDIYAEFEAIGVEAFDYGFIGKDKHIVTNELEPLDDGTPVYDEVDTGKDIWNVRAIELQWLCLWAIRQRQKQIEEKLGL